MKNYRELADACASGEEVLNLLKSMDMDADDFNQEDFDYVGNVMLQMFKGGSEEGSPRAAIMDRLGLGIRTIQ